MKNIGKINFTCNESANIRFKIKNIIQMSLAGLEAFLENVSKKIPNSLNTIVDHLISEFEKIEDYHVSLSTDYKILRNNPQLINKSINIILSLLNFPKYQQNSIDEEIDVDVTDIIHAFNHFEYFFIDSLLKIMSREEAIKYYQNFVNKLTQSRRDPTKYLDTLQDLVKNFKEFSERWHDLEAVLEIIDEGKLIYKIKKCRWAEDLKNFKPEIGYTLMCHQDYERAKNFNPNFILTRTKTILMGDDYCDFCYHDTRKDKDLTHPSEKDFQKLG